MVDGHTKVSEDAFEQAVEDYYQPLYRFALSLTHQEMDACDLVQETFRRLAEKGHQLRDNAKMKTWLFTTLYRRYVTLWRKETRHPHCDLDGMEPELPVTLPTGGDRLDADTVQEALAEVDEIYRAPLVLFYLEEHSYAQIAEILGIRYGTVMSRIHRGRLQLRKLLEDRGTKMGEAGRGAEEKITQLCYEAR